MASIIHNPRPFVKPGIPSRDPNAPVFFARLHLANGETRDSIPFGDYETAAAIGKFSKLVPEVGSVEVVRCQLKDVA